MYMWRGTTFSKALPLAFHAQGSIRFFSNTPGNITKGMVIDDHLHLVCQISEMVYNLGGGFKYVFYVHPYLGKWSSLTSIFFRWAGSTTNNYNHAYHHQYTLPKTNMEGPKMMVWKAGNGSRKIKCNLWYLFVRFLGCNHQWYWSWLVNLPPPNVPPQK